MRYLLRFETTDDEGECRPRVQAIRFPEVADGTIYHQHIHEGISKGQLNVAWVAPIILGEDSKLWVLQEEFHGSKFSYQWILKHCIRPSEMPGLVLRAPAGVTCLVGFHPNEDAIVFITLDHFQFHYSCYHRNRKLLRSSVSTSYDYAIYT